MTEAATRTSRLKLTFVCRDGKTVLERQHASYPLKVLRPFELGDGRALLQLLNVGPGLLAGDTYELDITVRGGAKVVLVNQSATKVHTMPPGTSARQTLHVTVEAGGELESYPGLVIPFVGSDAAFTTIVALEEGSRFVSLESWAMGRVGRGELFAFRRLSSRFRVTLAGKLVYADALELAPEGLPLMGVTDGFPYLASGFWQWDTPWTVLEEAFPLVMGSCGPERGYLRALAADGLELRRDLAALLQAWHIQRGVAPLPLSRLML